MVYDANIQRKKNKPEKNEDYNTVNLHKLYLYRNYGKRTIFFCVEIVWGI